MSNVPRITAAIVNRVSAKPLVTALFEEMNVLESVLGVAVWRKLRTPQIRQFSVNIETKFEIAGQSESFALVKPPISKVRLRRHTDRRTERELLSQKLHHVVGHTNTSVREFFTEFGFGIVGAMNSNHGKPTRERLEDFRKAR